MLRSFPVVCDKMEGDNKSVLEACKQLTDNLLQCSFGLLLRQAQQAKDALVTTIRTAKISGVVKGITAELLNGLCGFNFLENFVAYQIYEFNHSSSLANTGSCGQSSVWSAPLVGGETEGDKIVICRICEQAVSVDMIEEHSRNCLKVYEASSHILTLDERIDGLQDHILTSLLYDKWPGGEQRAMQFSLPLLHIVLLLERIQGVDPGAPSARSDLRSLAEVFDTIPVSTEDRVSMPVLEIAENYAKEKLKDCEAFSHARSLQRRTSLKQTEIRPISIADFCLVKRISCGAYARVFLGRKIRTGDIYAIKVTPRSKVKLKNEVNRVLTEKDILMAVSSPFIVNLCMFLAFCFKIGSKNANYKLTHRLFNCRNSQPVHDYGVCSRRRFVFAASESGSN
jgi:hypothetical protein